MLLNKCRITLVVFFLGVSLNVFAGPIIIDHNCTKLSDIPQQWIEKAKKDLHIAYGHTSHGSQLTTGMRGLVSFKGSLYSWNRGGSGGALDLAEPIPGAGDLGAPNTTTWAIATRKFLDSNPKTNVIIWSWCGQVSWLSSSEIKGYLELMDSLEKEYPKVKFVYMTGHLDGSGVKGKLSQRNQQIRDFCIKNNKILYDFNDIESYDPDGYCYTDFAVNDACDYDSDGDGSRDRNWAKEWQDSHKVNVDWYNCASAHSQPLNANQKAYAAWWLWARLAGWQSEGNVAGQSESLCPNCSKPLRYISEYSRWYCDNEEKYMDEGYNP